MYASTFGMTEETAVSGERGNMVGEGKTATKRYEQVGEGRKDGHSGTVLAMTFRYTTTDIHPSANADQPGSGPKLPCSFCTCLQYFSEQELP